MLVRRAATSAVLVTMLLLVFQPRVAHAHPPGNIYTVNFYVRIEPYPTTMRVLYLLDLAEVPSLDEAERIDLNENSVVDPDERERYLLDKGSELTANLTMLVDGEDVPLDLLAAVLERVASPYGIETYRVRLALEAIPRHSLVGTHRIEFTDENALDRDGWREILVAERPDIEYDAPPEFFDDRTRELTVFKVGLFEDAPRTTSAAFSFTLAENPIVAPPSPAASLVPRWSPDALIDEDSSAALATPAGSARAPSLGPPLLASDSGIAVLGALLAAVVVGALHALEPGHGKTLVAATFAGSRSASAVQALGFGALVALAHSVGIAVLFVGLVAGADRFEPARVFPWLGLFGGMLVIAIGVGLGLELLRSRSTNDAAGGGSRVDLKGGPPWRRLLVLGLVHGLVPTPATILTLLAAVSLGQVRLGLLLIAAFALGFGVMLAAVAAIALGARRVLLRRLETARSGASWLRIAQLTLSGLATVVVLVYGLVLTFQAAARL
ncbi:MAG: hypothetical protein R3C39_12465 [Dehalococcoidia bacterium]